MAEEAHGSHDTGAGGSLFSSVIAIIAFIILIVIVLWGLVHLTSFSRTWLGSLFNRPAQGITVVVPKDATSTVPFNVSWKYSTTAKGTYAFLYQCKQGLQVRTPAPNGADNLIPCGAAYTIPTTNTSLTVLPLLSGTSTTTSVPVSIIFMPSATSTSGAQGSASVAIHQPSALPTPVPSNVVNPTTTTTPPPTPASNTTTEKPARVYHGSPDLAVRIIAVGVIDPSTGRFVNRTPTSPSETSAVQFDVSNIGGAPSGSYYFEARLPTASGYTYNSSVQNPLGPGDHVMNTLRFTDIGANGGNVYITITTEDVNNANNDTSAWMSGTGYSGYEYNSYPAYTNYQQYQYVPPQPMYYYDPSVTYINQSQNQYGYSQPQYQYSPQYNY